MPELNQIYVVDRSISGWEQIRDGLPIDATVFYLDPASDGVAQLATLLYGRAGIDALHIFSHGTVGAVQLGGTCLDTANVDNYALQWASIKASLTDTADILLYGCDVAAGDVGQAFIAALANATGADVAASTDTTGAAALGGNWGLEAASGQIETSSVNVPSYNQILASNPVISWTQWVGGGGDESAKALTTGLDGALYVTGYTQSTTLDGQTSNGSTDVFLTKYQPDGTKVWTRLLGGNSTDLVYDLAAGLDGALYVTGYTQSTTLDGQKPDGFYSAYIAKYQPDGNKEWTRLMGGAEYDYGFALTTGLDGAIYMGGTRNTYSPSPGYAFITKYQPDGTATWAQFLGGVSTRALTTGRDGGIYLTGDTQSTMLDGQAVNGGTDVFLTKYQPDGTKVWTRLLGGGGDESAKALTTGLDGALYVTGYTQSTTLDGQTSNGSTDVFLTKYQPDGTKVWTRLLGGSGSDTANALTTGVDGAIYVGGYTQSTTIDGQAVSGGRDAFIAKYQSDGTKVWTLLLGTEWSYSGANALTTGLDGALYAGGSQTRTAGLDAIITRVDVNPTYKLTATLTSVNEGGSVTFTVSTTNVDSGTVLNYALGGSGINSSDVVGSQLAGTTTVGANGQSTFTVNLASDQLTEGPETLTATVMGQSASVTVNDTSTTLVPTYSISAQPASVNEGSGVTYTVRTTNVAADTQLTYVLGGAGITASDVVGGLLSGTTTVGAIGQATFTVNLAADQFTEGVETLTATVQGQSASVTVNDSSMTPVATYAISASPTSVNEGSATTFTIATTNVAAGTQLNYSLSGTGITTSDVVGGQLNGTTTVGANGQATFTVNLVADQITEGTETLTATVMGQSASLTVNDMSLSMPDLHFGNLNGINLNLIYPIQLPNGKSYYFLDNSGDGTANKSSDPFSTSRYADAVSHDLLDALLNGGQNTIDTQTSGAVSGIDDARTVNVPGFTLVIPTKQELFDLQAIGAYPGNSLFNHGWADANFYWSATEEGAGHFALGLNGGSGGAVSDGTQLFVAFQAVPDAVPPNLSFSTPADNATAVPVGSNLTLTFSEAVTAGTGNIVLTNTANGGDTRLIAVTDTTQVNISGSTVTVNPTADLQAGAHYALTMAAGVIKDMAGNSFAGFANGIALDFYVSGFDPGLPDTVTVTYASDPSVEVKPTTGPIGFDTLDLSGVIIKGAFDFQLTSFTAVRSGIGDLKFNLGEGFDEVRLDGRGLGVSVFGRDSQNELVTVSPGGNDIDLGRSQSLPAGGQQAEADVVSYEGSNNGVTLNLGDVDVEGSVRAIFSATSAGGTVPTADTLSNIEGIFGSRANDIITGDGNANLLAGNAGEDILDGGGGDDLLYGGAGNDILSGGAGNDCLVDFQGTNIFTGGTGNDIELVGVSGTKVTDFELAPELTGLPGRGIFAKDSIVFRTDFSSYSKASWATLLGVDQSDAKVTEAYDASNGAKALWDAFLDRVIYPHVTLQLSEISGRGNDRLFNMLFTNDRGISTILSQVELDGVAANLGTAYQLSTVYLDRDFSANSSDGVLDRMFGSSDGIDPAGVLILRGTVEMQRSGTLLDAAGNDVLLGGAEANILVASKGNDLLAGGRGGDRYEYRMQDLDPNHEGSDDFGQDLITDWGNRGSTDADVLFIEGVANPLGLQFSRITYAREAAGGSLEIGVHQFAENSVRGELNHGTVILFNQYSRSQAGYRIENLVLNEVGSDGRVHTDASGKPIEHVYDLGKVVGQSSAGGDILTMSGKNDAILVGSSGADDFQLGVSKSGAGYAAGTTKVYLSAVEGQDRLTLNGQDLFSFLHDTDQNHGSGTNFWTDTVNANGEKSAASGAPHNSLTVILQEGNNTSLHTDDTLLQLIFTQNSITADDYLNNHTIN